MKKERTNKLVINKTSNEQVMNKTSNKQGTKQPNKKELMVITSGSSKTVSRAAGVGGKAGYFYRHENRKKNPREILDPKSLSNWLHFMIIKASGMMKWVTLGSAAAYAFALQTSPNLQHSSRKFEENVEHMPESWLLFLLLHSVSVSADTNEQLR